MRWLRYSADGSTGYGVVHGDLVEEVLGSPFGSYEQTGRHRPLNAVKIEVPVIPQTFYAAGLNYAAHAKEVAAKLGKAPDLPKKPDVNYRAVNALIAHDEPVVIPKDATDQVQYEGELVAVIGRKAKGLSKDDALSCVLGYTIGNDISERTWQATDRTLWRSKNTDTFKPMGPWIETEVDLDAMRTTVRLNGKEMIQFRTNDMLFSIAQYISRMSQYVTLYPGDVIWMGTDGASANMRAGDIVEVELSGIGTLRNPITAQV